MLFPSIRAASEKQDLPISRCSHWARASSSVSASIVCRACCSCLHNSACQIPARINIEH